MSKVQLAGNANGTGIFTIASPNSNTDRTIALPDAAGTIQVSGNPISGTTGTFTGLLNISAAGAGQIQFPATQNASSNANTLDDYEEGTWTPALNFSGDSTGIAYANQSGTYVKVGRNVIACFYLSLSNSGTATGSGRATLTGLPFTVANAPSARGGSAAGYYDNFTGLTGGILLLAEQNATESILRYANTALASDLIKNNFTNSSSIYGTYVYVAAN